MRFFKILIEELFNYVSDTRSIKHDHYCTNILTVTAVLPCSHDVNSQEK